MLAKEIMSRPVRAVDPSMTVRELAKLFVERRITGAPVVDRDGTLLGVVSQTDLVRFERDVPPETRPPVSSYAGIPRGFHLESPDYTSVSQIMTTAVLSASEDTPVAELARVMLRAHIHRVVILRKEEIVGIVSSLDLLRALLTGKAPGGGPRKRRRP